MGVCAICGGTATRLHYARAADYITGDAFEVWRCAVCGCGATQPVPAELGKYYPAQYRQYNQWIARILEILYGRRVRGWCGMFKAPGRVFEIGCGNGLMLSMLQKRGWTVLGSERTEGAAAQARAEFGVTVLTGPVEDVTDSNFDLVLLIQVLEHLENPASALRTLAGMLSPAGKLVIGVPNFGGWQAGFLGAGWFHLDVPRHLRHYTLQGLTILLAAQGLAIERISYVSPEHDPYGWIQSVLNKLDAKPNRLTRLLMRIDPPDAWNILHLVAGCALGVVAVPVSLASWLAGRGAILEIVCARRGYFFEKK